MTAVKCNSSETRLCVGTSTEQRDSLCRALCSNRKQAFSLHSILFCSENTHLTRNRRCRLPFNISHDASHTSLESRRKQDRASSAQTCRHRPLLPLSEGHPHYQARRRHRRRLFLPPALHQSLAWHHRPSLVRHRPRCRPTARPGSPQPLRCLRRRSSRAGRRRPCLGLRRRRCRERHRLR